ncbi:siderophore-interacting protein [Microbacteriaceae bacterium VKM Ac-2855]|nr:siderophore-interacting protein [Microbacteriaceae bacterium VKM Ac-2855]
MLTTTAAPARPGYRPFRVRVAAVNRLSPHFVRVTFTGDDLDEFGTGGLDTRIKLVMPTSSSDIDGFARAMADDESVTGFAADWYERWRSLDADRRNPIRTYTARAVRPARSEVDIDFVAHGDAGPASAWVGTARPGDELVLVGPDALAEENRGGICWHPGTARSFLLAGDETAVPAIASILETLPQKATGAVFLEVPTHEDRIAISAPVGVSVQWVVRGGAEYGAVLRRDVRRWAKRFLTAHHHGVVLDDVDVDTEILWDVPDETVALSADEAGLYAWIAGEAGAVKRIRRDLVTELGLDRRQVAFMGYWRNGRAENN